MPSVRMSESLRNKIQKKFEEHGYEYYVKRGI